MTARTEQKWAEAIHQVECTVTGSLHGVLTRVRAWVTPIKHGRSFLSSPPRRIDWLLRCAAAELNRGHVWGRRWERGGGGGTPSAGLGVGVAGRGNRISAGDQSAALKTCPLRPERGSTSARRRRATVRQEELLLTPPLLSLPPSLAQTHVRALTRLKSDPPPTSNLPLPTFQFLLCVFPVDGSLQALPCLTWTPGHVHQHHHHLLLLLLLLHHHLPQLSRRAFSSWRSEPDTQCFFPLLLFLFCFFSCRAKWMWWRRWQARCRWPRHDSTAASLASKERE